MKNRLTGITIATFDMQAMLDFYSNVFDIKFTPISMGPYIIHRGDLKGLILELCPAELAKNTAQQNRHQLKIATSNIHNAAALTKKHGGSLMGEITKMENESQLAILDPDQNSIVLVQSPN